MSGSTVNEEYKDK
jgi:hypothetical protein